MKTPRVVMTRGSWTALIVRRLRRLGADVTVLESGQGLGRAFHQATHVLLPGGADIHPVYYGQPVTYARPSVPERDKIEYELTTRALAAGRPMFGICRGHQMIAVAAGGELYQDIPEQHRNHGWHRNLWHPIQVCLETRLSDAIGPGMHLVNSYHHQAIHRMPTGWRVAARAFDGVVEATEHPDLPVLSVQWHPEYQPTWASTCLFSRFLGFI